MAAGREYYVLSVVDRRKWKEEAVEKVEGMTVEVALVALVQLGY